MWSGAACFLFCRSFPDQLLKPRDSTIAVVVIGASLITGSGIIGHWQDGSGLPGSGNACRLDMANITIQLRALDEPKPKYRTLAQRSEAYSNQSYPVGLRLEASDP